MGVCDSTSGNSKNNKDNDSLSSLENYSTGSFTKGNSKKKSNSNYQTKDGFILPENLSKRTNINKYYNITQKVLGEGASGVVCIGEKGGKQYAIKKSEKIKLKL